MYDDDESALELSEHQRVALDISGDLEISDEVSKLVADALDKGNQEDGDSDN